jgi:alpha-beta hydrolase superfamily lysophospholipase
MAEQLAQHYNIATYLFDIRGHGRSGGPRGHVVDPSSIWHDVRTALEYVQKSLPGLPVFVGGHSGGASMLLNYQLWQGKKDPQGYFFVVPAFGPQAGVNRTRVATQSKRRPFVEVNHWVLLLHYLSGGYIGGDWCAATFHYPDHLVADRGFITSYTANMVSALAPYDVVRSLRQISVSLYICIADQDELFDPIKTDHFLEPIMQLNNHITTKHLPDAHHLTILGSVHDYIGSWIKEQL